MDHKASPSTLDPSFSLVEFIWVGMLQKFSSFGYLFLLGSHVDLGNTCGEARSHAEKTESTRPCEVRGGPHELTREDVETVFERMGLSRSHAQLEGESLKERMAFNELSTMFEGKEPSLEEVKAAFSVFDENCDGSIEAAELQRVLSKLGFREGAELEACKQMIAAYDENQDGKIDFNEFVKFMEGSFC